jgi:hypothetical protein
VRRTGERGVGYTAFYEEGRSKRFSCLEVSQIVPASVFGKKKYIGERVNLSKVEKVKCWEVKHIMKKENMTRISTTLNRNLTLALGVLELF